MKCCEVENLLSAFLDGEVTAEEKEKIEAHLISCLKCQDELVALEQIKVLLGNLGTLEPPDGFHEQLMKRITYERENKSTVVTMDQHRQRKSLLGRWNKKWSIAASVASIALCLSMTFSQFGQLIPKIALPEKSDLQDVIDVEHEEQTNAEVKSNVEVDLTDNNVKPDDVSDLNNPAVDNETDRNSTGLILQPSKEPVSRTEETMPTLPIEKNTELPVQKEIAKKLIRSVNLVIAVSDLNEMIDDSTQEGVSHIAGTSDLNYTLSVPNDLMPGMVDELVNKGTVLKHEISEKDITEEYNQLLKEKDTLEQQINNTSNEEQLRELEQQLQQVNTKLAEMDEEVSKTSIDVKMEEAK